MARDAAMRGYLRESLEGEQGRGRGGQIDTMAIGRSRVEERGEGGP